MWQGVDVDDVTLLLDGLVRVKVALPSQPYLFPTQRVPPHTSTRLHNSTTNPATERDGLIAETMHHACPTVTALLSAPPLTTSLSAAKLGGPTTESNTGKNVNELMRPKKMMRTHTRKK